MSVAFAESCTGGLLSEWFSRIPGISRIFLGGITAYHNQVKMNVLGVSKKILKQWGAVSPETAQSMASGVRKITGADACAAVTGIAGPDGGTPEKPVGTVCVCVFVREKTVARTYYFNGTRSSVRHQAVKKVFQLLNEIL